ncbi:UDP-N-acetylglucosamine 1-carboxyvinyltransferase [Sandaracinus amylolyticus]|uniref:UDP-N-acetylglucosamine 1-carboxyvinyltransferase n=1 Tax=Sandaracinus amylolyticus TaxID=927083 RepID=UPI001EFFD5C0|nr:UDP-N-acetylglucosamine 1-carboxyvinyltransferase [Sandaracinus amylolyticus]UJR81816.1 UDP-N-acetylglucosamine 1-carboxyvinyltransferase [Sandaracinus amylolyticus]
MDNIKVRGGTPLRGTLRVSGAKNAALPILCSALLADGEHVFRNVPDLRDIVTTAKLLEHMGLEVDVNPPVVTVRAKPVLEPDAPYELVKQMRASVLVLGPLVARYGRARVSLPGGCAIGARPIDQHLKGLEAMGAEIDLSHGYVNVTVPSGRLKGAEIHLDIPTVTGTENLMCAAVLAKGRTRLANAAREPEVEELACVLNKMGASVEGAGTDVITIEGKDELHPVDHAIIADRIEAGTYMVGAAVTGGNVLLEGITFDHIEALCAKMRSAGIVVEREAGGIRVVGKPPFKPVDVTTEPHPGFPTDMQAQFMLLMCMANGSSVITETIFENRFMHVPELVRMGARIDIRGRSAFVHGPSKLQGARVMATDLRASASLVLAGLVAQGETEVLRVYHIDRGYERIEEKLRALGADIERVKGSA